ncbi:hypothetical protein Bp8pS_261 [Bacillus phage vB_BpuM-BpSp]|nr:hypothetical protein Bp8pS_261 [Bacillus phage vB_BpuM-BpSp]
MDYNYFSIDNDLVIFNYQEFLTVQERIQRKFKINYSGTELFDKFAMQTLEEIFEVLTEKSGEEGIKKEIVDVIMYLGSLYSALFDDNFKNKDIKEDTIKLELYEVGSMGHYPAQDVEYRMIATFKSIFKLRTLLKDRKWHKKTDYSLSKNLEDLRSILESIRYMISYLVEFLIEYSYNNINELNSLFKAKQSFILNLE